MERLTEYYGEEAISLESLSNVLAGRQPVREGDQLIFRECSFSGETSTPAAGAISDELAVKQATLLECWRNYPVENPNAAEAINIFLPLESVSKVLLGEELSLLAYSELLGDAALAVLVDGARAGVVAIRVARHHKALQMFAKLTNKLAKSSKSSQVVVKAGRKPGKASKIRRNGE